jgi:hypothetical protein
MSRIPRREERMLERWFCYGGGAVHSAGGAVEDAGPIVRAVREHRRDHNRRVRELHAAMRERGRAPKPSDPWDPIPITAQPTSPRTARQPSYELDEAQLIESGRVRRRLDQLQPIDAGTLGVVFGVIGSRYAAGDQPADELAAERRRRKNAQADDWGQLPRVYSLVHALPVGRELFERADPLLGRELPAAERMRLHLLLRHRAPYAPLQELIERALLAAELRFATAADAWNATASGGRAA